jgi:hypothetical protein
VAVVEGRDGADGTRQRLGHRRLVGRRINEGDGGSGEVRVLSCRGGVAPVTSLEYRGCWGGESVASGGGDAALATSGRSVVGGARGGGVRGCCWRRKPKKEAMTEAESVTRLCERAISRGLGSPFFYEKVCVLPA